MSCNQTLIAQQLLDSQTIDTSCPTTLILVRLDVLRNRKTVQSVFDNDVDYNGIRNDIDIDMIASDTIKQDIENDILIRALMTDISASIFMSDVEINAIPDDEDDC